VAQRRAAWQARLQAELARVLDKYYIPTRYPNGLPGGIPSQAYTADDARQAIAAAVRVLEAAAQRRTSAP
jgi:HEPN domain-containing protein